MVSYKVKSKAVYIDSDAPARRITNLSGATVYYGSESVSTSTYDGSLVVGANIVLPAGKWFVSSGHASLTVEDYAQDPSLVSVSAVRGQPLVTRSRSTLILDVLSGSPHRSIEVVPRQFVRDTDGSLYLIYTGKGTGNSGQRQMCRAKSDSGTPYGPFTDQGIIFGGASAYDHCHFVREGSNWYAFTGRSANGSTVRLLKSTTGLFGTYSQIIGAVAALGTTGAWDVARTMEPFGFRVPTKTAEALNSTLGFTPAWGLAYMGFDTGNAHEQVGLAFAASIENSGSSYTKLGGSGVTLGLALPVGTGTTVNEYDAEIISDPFLFHYGGLYWLFYCGGRPGAIATTGRCVLAVATSPDLTTWTKWGPQLEAPVGDCVHWRGSFYFADDGLVYWPHAGTQDRDTIRGYMDVIDPVSFIDGPREGRWQKVQGESSDPRITKTGSWANASATMWAAGSSAYAGQAGAATFSFTFHGTGVRWATAKNTSYGNADVYLDGSKVSSFDAYSTVVAPTFGYEVTDVDEGEHTLRIDCLATKNSSSSGADVYVDYIEYLPGSGLAG